MYAQKDILMNTHAGIDATHAGYSACVFSESSQLTKFHITTLVKLLHENNEVYNQNARVRTRPGGCAVQL